MGRHLKAFASFPGWDHLYECGNHDRPKRFERCHTFAARDFIGSRIPRCAGYLLAQQRSYYQGLTTVRSIQLVTALGTVAGTGEFALAAAVGLTSLVVLASLRHIIKVIGKRDTSEKEASDVYQTI